MVFVVRNISVNVFQNILNKTAEIANFYFSHFTFLACCLFWLAAKPLLGPFSGTESYF